MTSSNSDMEIILNFINFFIFIKKLKAIFESYLLLFICYSNEQENAVKTYSDENREWRKKIQYAVNPDRLPDCD